MLRFFLIYLLCLCCNLLSAQSVPTRRNLTDLSLITDTAPGAISPTDKLKHTDALDGIIDDYVDIKCILNDTSVYQGCLPDKNYVFEEEQQIAGQVTTAERDNGNYKVSFLVPSTGFHGNLIAKGDKTFCIRGIDIVDGTTVILQATDEKGKFVKINIAPQTFPYISTSRFRETRMKSASTVSNELREKALCNKTHNSIELPSVEVKGKKFVPRNRMKFTPDRSISEGNPLLEKAPTMENLLSRFGLKKGYELYHDFAMDEDITVEGMGRVLGWEFVLTEIIVDDMLITGYELSDVLNIRPSNISKVEYFLPSNHEMFGNLAGIANSSGIRGLYGDASKRALLMIWTKKRPNNNENDDGAVLRITPLGYFPQI